MLHLPTASGQLSGVQLGVVTTGFEEALERSSDVLGLHAVDVFAIHAPQLTIPSWGCGGYTYSPHSVVLALDSSVSATVDSVKATLVHEFHHVMRERGPGCGTSLRERIVSEGLAMLFEEEVLGEASEFAHQPITNKQIRQAIEALDEDPANDGRWFFHAADLPLWFGYTAGYRWARSYSDQTGKQASDLVDVPAMAVTQSLEHAQT